MKRRQRGFTLVEIMLAALLTAIVMSMVYGMVVSTIQAQRRVEEVMRSTEIGPSILSQIRSDLVGAFIPEKGKEGFVARNSKGSSGDRDRIDFVSSTIAYGPEEQDGNPVFHSTNELGYQVLENPKDGNVGILYRREEFFVDRDPMRGGRLMELYDRVSHFDCQFWDGEQWVEEWDSKNQEDSLPPAIRVELRILVNERDNPNRERTYVTTITFPAKEPPVPEAPVDGTAPAEDP